jgi:DNA repair protein RecO (recombination protein O)
MPLHKTEAFVLRTYSLAEADKICVFLAKDSGKVRGVAHGARKLRSRFGSSLEPLTQVALTFYEKEGRELVSISSCDIVQSHFRRAALDFQTASAFSYMAEMLVEFLPDREPNEHVYRLLAATLESIEDGKRLLLALRYFESWLLRLLGFFPDTSQCVTCYRTVAPEEPIFLTTGGEPRCTDCSAHKGTRVTPIVREMISRILRVGPAVFAGGEADRAQLAELREINYLIIRNALERDLRSHALLKQLNAL